MGVGSLKIGTKPHPSVLSTVCLNIAGTPKYLFRKRQTVPKHRQWRGKIQASQSFLLQLPLAKMVHNMKRMTFTQKSYYAVFIVQCIHLKNSRVLIRNLIIVIFHQQWDVILKYFCSRIWAKWCIKRCLDYVGHAWSLLSNLSPE